MWPNPQLFAVLFVQWVYELVNNNQDLFDINVFQKTQDSLIKLSFIVAI